MRDNSMDSRFFQFVNTAADLALASILWLVCSLPVVTVGMASAALCHTVERAVIQDRGTVLRVFGRSLAESWRTALPAGVLSLLVGGATCAAAGVCLTDAQRILLLPLLGCLGMLFLWLAAQVYLYPLIGNFTLNGRHLIEMVLQLVFLHPLKSAGLTLGLLMVAGAVAGYPPLALILPGVFVYFAAKVYDPLFLRYIRVTNAEPAEKSDA